jgi:hypothetical protein
MIKVFGLFILLGLFSGFCGKSGEASAKFGEKAKFSQNAPVRFDDFTLTYTGERRVISDLPRQGKSSYWEFVYFDFKIQSEKEEQTISWSSGTGDIEPTAFTIGAQKYELELAISDRIGRLAENELIIWKKY